MSESRVTDILSSFEANLDISSKDSDSHSRSLRRICMFFTPDSKEEIDASALHWSKLGGTNILDARYEFRNILVWLFVDGGK